jgi:hypothetical protein
VASRAFGLATHQIIRIRRVIFGQGIEDLIERVLARFVAVLAGSDPFFGLAQKLFIDEHNVRLFDRNIEVEEWGCLLALRRLQNDQCPFKDGGSALPAFSRFTKNVICYRILPMSNFVQDRTERAVGGGVAFLAPNDLILGLKDAVIARCDDLDFWHEIQKAIWVRRGDTSVPKPKHVGRQSTGISVLAGVVVISARYGERTHPIL